MQAKLLLERTECTAPTLKDWLNKGVIVPAQPGHGKGTHAVYDEANAAALLIGMRMKGAGVIVTNYSVAFRAMQLWLRETSSFEWHRYQVVLTIQDMSVYPIGKAMNLADMALVAPLAPICKALTQSVEIEPQFSIFGLHSVKQAI